jgi:2-polyprenyl-3-methyl-5-hydroxy-6-metoxy-1,4-benzoquinol methylase
MDEHQYIINSGISGAERLKVLFETLLPGTKSLFSRAEINNANKILDIGCGGGDITDEITNENLLAEVDAYDFDELIIEIAKKRLSDKKNINFKIFDISSGELKTEEYDLIIARFLLSHLKNPQNAIEKFKTALKIGGKIIVEDVDFDGHFCYPESPAFNKYVEYYTKASMIRGMDPFIGKKLLLMLHEAGFKNIDMEIVNPAFNSGKGKLMGILTLKNIAPAILNEQLADIEELTQNIKELEEFTERLDSLLSLPRIFRLIAYK